MQPNTDLEPSRQPFVLGRDRKTAEFCDYFKSGIGNRTIPCRGAFFMELSLIE